MISKRLAPLASLAAQRRFIVHGTKDKYYLPSELLNDAYDLVRHVRTIPTGRRNFSDPAAKTILGLENLLQAASQALDHCGNEELIERNEAWRAVREHAARCLEVAGFDLEEWERSEKLEREG